jgi:hypothetical protein
MEQVIGNAITSATTSRSWSWLSGGAHPQLEVPPLRGHLTSCRSN